MQLRSIVSAVIVACAAFSGSANALVLGPTGTLGANSTYHISNDELGTGAFTNTFTFTLPFVGNQGGGLWGFGFGTANPGTVIDYVTLTATGYNFSDDTPSNGFNFSEIPAFTPVTLSIFGNVTGSSGGYVGSLTTNVSAVPEASSLALALAGLGVVGFVARRRKV